MKTIKKISELEECQKRYIVHQYACFVEPVVLQGMLRDIYDIHVPVDILVKMNPGLPSLCVLEEKWFKHFQKIHDEILETPFKIPSANIFQRLFWLEGAYVQARKTGDLELLKEITKEIRREVTPIYKEHVRLLKIEGAPGMDMKKYEA